MLPSSPQPPCSDSGDTGDAAPRTRISQNAEFIRERTEQRVDAKEERGRKDKRAKKSYQLESKQATEMIALKLFTPG